MFLSDLKPGEMFRRPGSHSSYRYIKSNRTEEGGGCYPRHYCFNLDGRSEGYFMSSSIEVVKIEPTVDSPAVDKGPSPFYMCLVHEGDPPRMRHDGIGAHQEAERLAKLTGRKVFVLKAVACVNYTPPTGAGLRWVRLGKTDC